jgi:hypothetical protein
MVNGRALGVAHNGVFDDANTDPIPGGRLWPEAALTWNAMRAEFIAGGGNPDQFRPGGPASSARSMPQQQHFFGHQPPPAAVPGTSNHGWGIAVDIPSAAAQAWLMRNGARFGWSHDEGARVGERWHFRYVGAPKAVLRKLQRDPFAGYTSSERRWIHEYDQLVRTHGDAKRREVLRHVMTAQRKRVWALARPVSRGGDGRRWTTVRRRRYASLLARTR